jgi:hypothetical protein
MAITKIWNIAKSRKGDLSGSLARSLQYIVNPEKTDGGLLVGGVNCFPDAEAAYQQMCGTKKLFGKELGRQGYHVVLSCPVGEGDPQTMYHLTEEFIHEFLGDRYEALFAVHVDRGHLHSHIVFNSCSIIDGYKFQYHKGDWKNVIQPITNRLCEKYGWSVMPAEYSREPQKMSRSEYEYQKSMKEVVLADVEYCMANAENLEEFLWNMEQMGYEVKKGAHIAVRMDGMKKFRRLDTWDSSLSVEKIEETLAAIRGKDVTVKVQSADPSRYEGRWKSDYQRNFYVKMVRLRQIETCRFTEKAAGRYRDLKRMHELQEQYLYLVNHDIKSPEELLDRRNLLQGTISEVGDVQKQFYKDNRRQKAQMQKNPVMAAFYEAAYQDNMEKLASLKEEKKKLYRELALVEGIADEAIYRSFVHPVFDEERMADISRPRIPESPWKKAARERMEAEMEKRRRKQQEEQRREREKGKSYYHWQSDCNSKFMDAVNLPSGTPWVKEYLDMLQELMNTSMNERTKDFFDTPVMAFEEFVERMEFGEKEKHEEPVYHARQETEEVRERVKEEEVRTLTELPDDFARFAQLTAEEQGQLLCHTRADVENATGLLQGYAKSVGYSFSSVDGLLDLSHAIQKAAEKSFLEKEAAPIVRELKNAGLDSSNFYQVKAESIAPVFSYLGNDSGRLCEVFAEVIRQMGVELGYDEMVDMAMDIASCVESRSVSKMPEHRRG